MSKPLTLISKFRLFMRYLQTQKNGVIVDCAYCKSIDVEFEQQLEREVGNRKI